MIEGPLAGLAYVLLKYLSYSAWCALGVRLFREAAPSPWRSGFQLGAVRLTLGLVFGGSLFLAVALHGMSGRAPLAEYFELYAPLRLVEWSILAALIQPGLGSVLVGPRRPAGGSRLTGLAWKLGGIVVSHLVDLPIILGYEGVRGMLPIGRFLC
jgi:hypothetical protein